MSMSRIPTTLPRRSPRALSRAGNPYLGAHYQLLNEALFKVIPPDAPFPLRPDAILDSDIEPLVAYLEKI
jgi:hypothetical protein